MVLPTHVIEFISGFADPATQISMGCTCQELKPLIRRGRLDIVRNKIHKIISSGILKGYGIINDWHDSLEHPEEWSIQRNIVPSIPAMMTMWCLYDRKMPGAEYRRVDPELYDMLIDEMKLGCPDITLLYSFWLSASR